MKETILIFNVSDEDVRRKLKLALLPHKVRLYAVERSEYNQPLGALANLGLAQRAEGEYCGEELEAPMLIFAFLSDDKLNRVLSSLRKYKLSLPYKAILTPTNSEWTPAECFNELKSERQAISEQQLSPHRNSG